MRYQIKEIKDSGARAGSPCCELEIEAEGSKTGNYFAIAYLNHDFADGRFVPRKKVNGEMWDYKDFDYKSPVSSVIPNSDIGHFVKEELEKRFREQRVKEGW